MKVFNTGKVHILKIIIGVSRYIDFKFVKDNTSIFIQVPFLSVTIGV